MSRVVVITQRHRLPEASEASAATAATINAAARNIANTSLGKRNFEALALVVPLLLIKRTVVPFRHTT